MVLGWFSEKKRKKTSRLKKDRTKLFIIILSLSLACLFGLGLFFYLNRYLLVLFTPYIIYILFLQKKTKKYENLFAAKKVAPMTYWHVCCFCIVSIWYCVEFTIRCSSAV